MLLIALYSCGAKTGINDPDKRNPHWCWFSNEKTGEGEWKRVDPGQQKLTGKLTFFWSNGNIAEIHSLDHGFPTDTIFKYDMQNNLIRYTAIQDGKSKDYYVSDGYHKDYFLNGGISTEGPVQNHKRVGKWISYRKTGKIEWIETHLDSAQTTLQLFYENGQIKTALVF